MDRRTVPVLFLLVPLFLCNPLHGEENKAYPELASLVPPLTLFYVRMPSLKRTWQSFQELPLYGLYRDEEVRAFLEAMGKGMEKKAPGVGSDIVQELLSLADLFDGEAAFAQISRKERRDWIFSMTSSAAEEEVTAFAKDVLTPYLQGVFDYESIKKEAGIEISAFSRPGPPIFTARLGRRILVAGRLERLAGLIEGGMGAEGSLAEKKAFRTAIDRVSQREAAFLLYLDVEGVLRNSEEKMDKVERAVFNASGLKSVRTLSASLSMKGRAEDRIWIEMREDPAGFLDIFAHQPVEPEAARIATESAYLFVAGHFDMPKLYRTLFSMAEASPHKGPFYYLPDAARNIKDELKLDLEEDAVRHMGAEVVFFADHWSDSGFIPRTALAIQVENPVELDKNLYRILRSESGRKPRSTDYRGRKIHYQQLPLYSIPLWLSWCVTDGYLIISLMPMLIKEVINRLDGTAPSLLDNPDFKEHWKTLSGNESVAVVVNSRRIFHFFYTILIYGWIISEKDLPFDTAWLPQSDTLASYLSFGLSGVTVEEKGILFRTRSDGYGPASLAMYGLTGLACWTVLVEWGQ